MASFPTLVLNSGRVGQLQAGDTSQPNPTKLNLGATDEALTISSGVITITKSRVIVDTESAAASDDLTTINGGNVGDILVVRAANDARTVVVKGNVGNILITNGFPGTDDKSLTNSWDILTLVRQADGKWHQVLFNDGAA